MSDREIKKLSVLCSNSGSGCDWQGELAKIDVHLMFSCEFQEVKCSNDCGMILLQQKLTLHLENDCLHRKIICEHCCVAGKYEWVVGEHKDHCPKLPVPMSVASQILLEVS